MRKAVVCAALGSLLWLVGICHAQVGGQNKEIDALRAEWVQDLETHKLEPSLALFADDAAFLSGDGSRMAGKDAIRGLYQQIFTTYLGQIALDAKQVVVSGALAYESGVYQETLTTLKTGAKQLYKGSYLMVYQRDPGGKWRFAQQAWTGVPVS
jgi:uncharacterized protein (TIGR02246 family)